MTMPAVSSTPWTESMTYPKPSIVAGDLADDPAGDR